MLSIAATENWLGYRASSLSPFSFPSFPYKVNDVYRFFMNKCIESPKVMMIQGSGMWHSRTVTEACHMIVSSILISVWMFQNFSFIHNISEESSINFLIVRYFGTSYDLFNLCKIDSYRWLIIFSCNLSIIFSLVSSKTHFPSRWGSNGKCNNLGLFFPKCVFYHL